MDLLLMTLHKLGWDTPTATINIAFRLVAALAIYHSTAYKTPRVRRWVIGTFIMWCGSIFVITYHVEAFQDSQAKLSLPVVILVTVSAAGALAVTGVCIASHKEAACLALATFMIMTGSAVMCWMYYTQTQIAMNIDLYRAWLLLEVGSLLLAVAAPFWMLGVRLFRKHEQKKMQRLVCS